MAKIIQNPGISEYPNSFKRQGGFPLDITSVKYGTTDKTSENAIDEYAKSESDGAYVGQILTGVDNDTVTSVKVIVNKAGDTQTVGYVGKSNTLGIKGFYWSSIDVNARKITLSTVNGGYGKSQTFSISDYWAVNDVISIHSNQKWTDCSKITAISGNTITVDSLPFDSPTVESGHITDQAVFVLKKPLKGLCEFGQFSVVFGESNKAENYATIVAGRQNEAIDQYAAVFGRQNVGDYACLVGGRNNEVRHEFGFASGSDNYIIAKQSAATGKANFIIGNAYRSTAMGAYNTIGGDSSALRSAQKVPLPDGEYVSNQPGQYGVALGYGNDVRGFVGIAIGDKNKVFGSNSSSIGRDNIIQGSNSVIIGQGKKPTTGSGFPTTQITTAELNNYSSTTIDASQTNATIISGASSNLIVGTGSGNMIIGSNCCINTRAKISGDTHTGGGNYNYIVGGDGCSIGRNAHQCVVGGKSNTATGYRSTLFGTSNNDGGKKNTTIFGVGNTATRDNQTIVGSYAEVTDYTVFAVGDGTSSEPKSLMRVQTTGEVWATGFCISTDTYLRKSGLYGVNEVFAKQRINSPTISGTTISGTTINATTINCTHLKNNSSWVTIASGNTGTIDSAGIYAFLIGNTGTYLMFVDDDLIATRKFYHDPSATSSGSHGFHYTKIEITSGTVKVSQNADMFSESGGMTGGGSTTYPQFKFKKLT